MKHIEKILAIGMLLFAVGINLWIYRLEPTATVDPNDNPFQFALVDRTNTMWDFATRTCPKNLSFPICHISYLVDHWVPNWAEGYNLPFYYGHMSQIAIVASYRVMSPVIASHVSLFQYYHLVIYFLLCFFPISLFLALRIIRMPWYVAGFGAILAMHLSTDGLYGLDPSSFIWRGYGLSSQLFAMVWFPFAIAYCYRFFTHWKPSHDSLWEKITSDGRIFLGPLLSPFRFLAEKSKNKQIIAFLPEIVLTPEQKELRRLFWLATLFMVITISAHLGIGIMAMMSMGVLAISYPLISFLLKQPVLDILSEMSTQVIRMLYLSVMSIFFLSYWILPIFMSNDYHNISFWDPIWKFNSYGWREVLMNFLNGALFDFGRFPILTVFILIGLIACFVIRQKEQRDNVTISTGYHLSPFAVLFIFWLLMYFGRTTWGSIIDIIPSMTENHLSRFIVGLHIGGMFLAPIAMYWIVQNLSRIATIVMSRAWMLPLEKNATALRSIQWIICLVIVVISTPIMYGQTFAYAQHNDRLIKQSNEVYAKQVADSDHLFASIRKLNPQARVFAGRGGGWGKDFKVSETQYFMHLSTYGIPSVLWLPETWSMNSDTEQFFTEHRPEHYDLFNMRYIAAPANQETQKFWKLLEVAPSWKLYETTTSGYISLGRRNMTVSSKKTNLVDIVHMWIQSEQPIKKVYPEISFKKPQVNNPVPIIEMKDEVTYQMADGGWHNIFSDFPFYRSIGPEADEVGDETNDTDMIFTSKFDMHNNCEQCIVILKQTAHPNWKAYIDNEPVKTMVVFPFYVAVLAPGGLHTITFRYQPSTLKVGLLVLAIFVGLLLCASYVLSVRKKHTGK